MGTLTINTTSEQDARIRAAFGSQLNLQRDATGAEIKAYVIEFVKSTVLGHERRAAAQIAADAVSEITPT